MTNHPSDNHSDRHDDLHPGGEGGHPVNRRGESLAVPNQVTMIESGALEDCGDLCAVKVPATIRVIERRAFPEREFLD
ncbi:MAG: hypothetical protein IKF77_06675 [Thermoguttaceae bacterium]|nr:hypothetical protein [Thermoguttaceae bacterium]MBR2584703.1 hypothetical protein [Thermoguttaceae bacterium]MBR3219588.1 hypothetical protein [Thermoguttaceae bacterium]